MKGIKKTRGANRAASTFRGPVTFRLLAAIAAAMACVLAIAIFGMLHKQPDNVAGSQANAVAGTPFSAPFKGMPSTGVAVPTPEPTALQPSLPDKPWISEVSPPLSAAGPVDNRPAGVGGAIEDSRYFTETGHYVTGVFLTYSTACPTARSFLVCRLPKSSRSCCLMALPYRCNILSVRGLNTTQTPVHKCN